MSKCSSESFKVSCGKVCDRLLTCLKHHCAQICHQGPCMPCGITKIEKCKCGKAERSVECGKEAVFQCDQTCGFQFDCKIHDCALDCHENSMHSTKCPYDPTILTTCPCGKTERKRLKCTDPIPTCNQACENTLSCGHLCIASCHNGEWYVIKELTESPPCFVPVEVCCRCEKEVIKKKCSEIERDGNGLPLCSNMCQRKKHCKRHRCGGRCCIMDIHICERICQKPLSVSTIFVKNIV
jgi:transcriptional repressor NF-X1